MKFFKKNSDLIHHMKSVWLAMFASGCILHTTNASDVEIYQAAKAGDITLMFLLDLSGSMARSAAGGQSACDLPSGVTEKSYTSSTQTYLSGAPSYVRRWCVGSNKGIYYDRITRVKDGMFDLLYGNTTTGVTKIDDDKVIGLSTFQGTKGTIRIPARRLDVVVDGTTQRQLLLNAIAALDATSTTPTANAYADVGAYMMGTNTLPVYTLINAPQYFSYTVVNKKITTTYYQTCNTPTYNSDNTITSCASWGNATTTQPTSSLSSYSTSLCTVGAYNGTCYNSSGTMVGTNAYSAFPSSATDTKSDLAYIQPTSLTGQTSTTQQCSGQGIYILTDGEPNQSSVSIASGLMNKALNTSNFNCNNSLLPEVNNPTYGYAGAWSCIGNYSQSLLTKTANPSGLSIKTAVVGFGSSFNGISSYSTGLTQAQNLANIENASISGNLANDVRNAARWGVYGGGGWYSGSDSADVVNSVNSFISNLGSSIPAVTTGNFTVPVDQLNPITLQPYAYFPMFQPTPDKAYQLWQGNVKKYNVVSGYLKDTNGSLVIDTSGLLSNTGVDLWAKNVTDTTLKAYGGVKANLLLGFDVSQATKRKVLTNRTTSGDATYTSLTQLNGKTVFQGSDPKKAYLLSALGFAVNPISLPASLADLAKTSELRQVGAVMHSSPILVTNKGKISSTNYAVSTDRADYVLFGTTQGAVQVVDASTGVEKFAFVPNEMFENQPEAFLKNDSTAGGMNNLYYGVDGAWTLYSQYTYDANNYLTVGSGLGTSSGTQIAYGGLRMGGRSYYALNLQDIDSPSLLFRIDPETSAVYYNNQKTSYAALSYMGQSWSKPTIARVKWNGINRLVMFVGGGYDKGYEAEYSQTNKVGAGVYMFDAQTGELLWWTGANATSNQGSQASTLSSDMKYSVPGQILTIDRDGDGLVDHLYFGDLGGQLWRVDLNNSALSVDMFAKTPVRLLNLNKGTYSPRFYDMPAFSIYKYLGQTFGVVSIGSGNRSTPLFEATATSDTTSYKTSGYNNDAIYNIYDKDVARSDLFSTTTNNSKTTYSSLILNTQDLSLLSSGTSTSKLSLLSEANRTGNLSSPLIASYGNAGGWYYYFASNKLQSEKVYATPIIKESILYTSTFDASKPGQSGDCGAGVKGESAAITHCLPFGQCSSTFNVSVVGAKVSLGAGIQTLAVSGGVNPTSDPNSDPTPTPTPVPYSGTQNSCVSSAASTEYITALATGPLATNNKKLCLNPVSWYEKSN